tara:strand:+ start:10569 stop:10937 length:369 start_codon:yes stop_codon:yes gene_type:complete
MNPVAFIGTIFPANYFIEYINVVCPCETEDEWTSETFINGFNQLFSDLDLTLGDDIFIIDTNSIEIHKNIEPNSYLIGMPMTGFPYELSVKRMIIDTFNLLESIDFLVEEPLECIEYLIFNI